MDKTWHKQENIVLFEKSSMQSVKSTTAKEKYRYPLLDNDVKTGFRPGGPGLIPGVGTLFVCQIRPCQRSAMENCKP